MDNRVDSRSETIMPASSPNPSMLTDQLRQALREAQDKRESLRAMREYERTGNWD